MRTLYLGLALSAAITTGSLSAQDTADWYPVQMDRLGFSAYFYQKPTNSTLIEGESMCHSFENKVDEKNHPNTSYKITVWESSNPADNMYAERKKEELATRKLHSQGLTLITKDILQGRAILFDNYMLQSTNGEYVHFYIGSGKNKVYTAEVITKEDEKYNADLILFIRSFRITLYEHQTRNLSIDSLSYTVDFPFPPAIQKTDAPNNGIRHCIIAFGKSEKKAQQGHSAEQQAIPPTEEEPLKVYGIVNVKGIVQTIPGQEAITYSSIHPIETYEISEICYDVTQMPEEIPDGQKESFLTGVMNMVLSTNSKSKLLQHEEIKSGTLEGVSFTYTGLYEAGIRTFLCRAFYTKHKLYVLNILLRNSNELNHPDVIRFLDSFHIKS